MGAEKKLSSVELERLLLRRRRQEAVEGLRLLSPLPDDGDSPSEVESLASAGLTRLEGSPPATKPTGTIVSRPLEAESGALVAPDEVWFCPRRVRLRPAKARRRSRRRPSHPLVAALKVALGRVVDTLIVLVLILFIAALGFWLYDNYLQPLMDRSSGSAAQAQWVTPFWSGQGRLSSPEEAVLPEAPLPFVAYSSTVEVEAPYVPVPTPAPGTVVPTRLVIPKIQLDTPVKEVTIKNGAWEVAEYAAGYHRGTARPGTVGNTVISGHKGLKGAVFRRLDELVPGDEAFLYAGPRLYRYIVDEKKSVWPHQVEVMAQTPEPIMTLITCTAYDAKRLIVVLYFDQEIPTGGGAGP